MSEPSRKDSEWLKEVLVELLDNARLARPVDHGACAKYADLLWKILPKGNQKDPAKEDMDAIRKAVIENGKPKKR